MRYDKASYSMALDDALLDGLIQGDIENMVRFYRFNPSAVSLGYFQCIRNEINIDVCKEKCIDIVRRPTGGGCVYHDVLGEITYSVITRITPKLRDIQTSYEIICNCIVNGLKELGITSEFNPVNDIVIDGKKISGSAQMRREDALLQHGTVMITTDIDTLQEILTVDKEKFKDKGVASLRKRITTLSECFEGIRQKDVYNSLIQGFSEEFGDEAFTDIPKKILQEAVTLDNEKYSKESFIFKR